MVTLDKVLSLLEQQGKSQKDLCEYLQINKQAFTNWKSGHTQSYKKYLPQIAEFLNVSVDYLLSKSDEKGKPTTNNGNELKSEFSIMLDKLSPEAIEQVRKYTRFLLDEQEREQSH